MKTILMLLKPVLELVLVALPGLILLALALLWWFRRQSRPDRGSTYRPPGAGAA